MLQGSMEILHSFQMTEGMEGLDRACKELYKNKEVLALSGERTLGAAVNGDGKYGLRMPGEMLFDLDLPGRCAAGGKIQHFLHRAE